MSVYLDQLSPAEVFQLLARAAEAHQGQYLDRVHIVFTGAEPFNFVALEVPDPYVKPGGGESPESLQVFKLLVEGFKELSGRRERQTSPGGETRPLLEGIAWLLLKSVDEAEEKTAESKGHQHLVVTRTLETSEAEILFRNLSLHATSTRVSSFDHPAGTGSRYLFHLKDDPQRKSSFSSLGAGGLWEEHHCQILTGFEVEGQVIFLPGETLPGERKLHALCRFVETAPALFGSKGKKRPNLVAAVLQWPEGEGARETVPPGADRESGLEFFYLGELRFFQQEFFTRRKVSRARFDYHLLTESQPALTALAAAIDSAAPGIGYSLELRASTHFEKNRLERLLDQKARLDHNIAYLQGITRPQPVLMRFSQQQLPALAAQIRSFPLHVLHDGRIQYGFQAFEQEPHGYHFILVDFRETARSEMDPLLLWQDPEINVPHLRFRLDPLWARHYFEAGGDSLVFVPENCTLFPPIHDWERGNMDRFLRETLEHWFQDRLEGQALPARPIYIFDGEPSETNPLWVSILDRERMQPLHLRLNWINDNLILNRALEKESLIREMAKDITWSQLARQIKLETEETRREFSETALATTRDIAQTTYEMTRVLTVEIDRIVKETFRMTQKIRKMNERLLEWDEVLEDMEGVLQEVRQQRLDTSHEKVTVKNQFWRMEQEIQREIVTSQKRRQEIEEKVAREITKMQALTQRLKQRLKSVKL